MTWTLPPAVVERPLRVTFRGDRRALLRAWQDRIRNPTLTALLVLQLSILFLALPLEASGVLIVEPVGWSLLLFVLSLVVVLSHRGIAIALIALGLAATAASIAFGQDWAPLVATLLNRGGIILVFLALTWVVAHAVYAPGRITSHRLQGAAIVYLSLAIIFATVFSLVWELIPGAFAHLPPEARGPHEFATMLYFSFATLTTAGYGDIVPVDPFARSLANLEAIVGQFYLAITVTRLVTLEMADRRRRGK
jgi:hypothetical protein